MGTRVANPATRLALAAVLVICALAYLPALDGQLIFDDLPLLKRQDCWRGLDKIPAMFGLGEENACTYRPVRYLTFALDYTLFGLDPTGLHVSNLVYHLLTSLVVFHIFRRWASPAAALLMAALWALHPVHTDAVAYISGRRDVVSTLFLGLAFLRLVPPEEVRLTAWRVISGVALYLLAIQTKEMAVTAPALVVWATVARHSGPRLGHLKVHLSKHLPVYMALFGIAAIYVVVRAVVASHSAIQGYWWGGSAGSNFTLVATLYTRYFELIVWPERLIGDYFPMTLRRPSGLADPLVLAGGLLYLAMLGLTALALRRGWRSTAFGIGWFLIAMLPVSHIFPHHELFAEHYLYLPLLGIFAAMLGLTERLIRTPIGPRVLAAVLFAAVFGASIARTSDRASDFQDARSFYTEAARHAPENGRVLAALGMIHAQAGDCDKAVPPLLGAAARFHYLHVGMARSAFVALVYCADATNEPVIVERVIDRFLERVPDDPFALSWRARRWVAEGSWDRAEADLRTALEITRGRDRDTVALLALTLNRTGRYEEALSTLVQYPHFARNHCEQRVRALIGLGRERYAEALLLAEDCLGVFTASPLLLELRAGLYLSAGRLDEADADMLRLEALGSADDALSRLRDLRARVAPEPR